MKRRNFLKAVVAAAAIPLVGNIELSGLHPEYLKHANLVFRNSPEMIGKFRVFKMRWPGACTTEITDMSALRKGYHFKCLDPVSGWDEETWLATSHAIPDPSKKDDRMHVVECEPIESKWV